MGKPTGFMEYAREDAPASSPKARIQNYNEFHEELSETERKQQAARCMDCGVPFCQYGKMISGMASGCPLNNLIPEWNDLLYTGNMVQAFNRLTKTNCFPEFTGRVCPALCEAACTCNLNGKPVTTKANELSIIENAYESGYLAPNPPKTRTGKRVAVVGSGPSGLSAAYWLNKRGHEVTVYERSDRPGGLLMYGIPNMKLEKRFVKRRVELMKAEGIHFLTGVNVGKDISAEDLKSQYDSVILACGASNPRDIQAEGRDAEGIYFAVDYLSRTTKSLLDSNLADGNYISAKDKHVVVIGGGLVGCETGLFLAELGKAVTIVEMQDEIAPEANWMHKEGMMQAFAKQNITTVTGRKVVSISEDGVTVADKNNETTVIASDSVVYAIGMRPNNHLVDELRDSAPFVRAVGDCVRARKVSPAIYEAYYAAVDLA